MVEIDKKQIKTPQLRFPEFSGEWEEVKLGEVAEFSKGKGLRKKDIVEGGENLCIHYGDLYTKYSEVINDVELKTDKSLESSVLSEEGDVLIPSSGETALDIATASCVNNNGVILGSDLNILKLNGNIVGEFLARYISGSLQKHVASFAQGNSVVHIYSRHLKKVMLSLPSIEEQKKIADFLSSVDGWIENLKEQNEKLEEYKQGLMQKLFPAKGESTPILRFGEFSGEWEEVKLGEVAEFSKGKGLRKKDIVEDGENKCIHYGELFTTYAEKIDEVVSKTNLEKDSMRLSKEGDVLMPTSDVTPDGLATASALDEEGIILGSDMLVIRSQEINSEFFSYYIAANQKDVMRLVVGVTVYHLYGSDMKTMEARLPSLEEQKKIADFLSAIDTLIDKKQEEIDTAREWKRGLMQKMFV